MDINNDKIVSNAIGDLYRASFFIAKGQRKLGISFFKKAKGILKNKILVNPAKIKNNLILAEKILDNYKRLISKS